MAPAPQNLQNHVRYVLLYHVVLATLLVFNLAYAVRKAWLLNTIDSRFQLMVAISLLIMGWYLRQFPLAVQDRVIRLEMRLRLKELAPELMPRFGQLTPGQLAALRFAGDGELVDLTRQVLEGKLAKGGDIKRAITDWQPDQLRA